ncbi:ATP-binding cassette-type vacuolar membrane transporter Hmt1 [Dimargaris cristalligena]|nr:ATP-binding cassette-type vacuolar membrane transporter Hmt1 [Dimargaris cristalligena]
MDMHRDALIVYLLLPSVLIAFDLVISLIRGSRRLLQSRRASYATRCGYTVLPAANHSGAVYYSFFGNNNSVATNPIAPYGPNGGYSYFHQAPNNSAVRRIRGAIKLAVLYFDLIITLFLVAIYQDKYTLETERGILNLILTSQVMRVFAWVWFLILFRPSPHSVPVSLLGQESAYHVLSWCTSVVYTSVTGVALFGLAPAFAVIPNSLFVTGLFFVQTVVLTTLLLSDLAYQRVCRRHQREFEATLIDRECAPTSSASSSADDHTSVTSGGGPPSTSFASEAQIRNPTVKFKPDIPPMSLSDFFARLSQLAPFLFPHQLPRSNYIYIALCFAMLALGRWVNILVPTQYKNVVNNITDHTLVSADVVAFVLLKVLQGDIGLLQTVHDFCWTPVSQFTTRAVAVRIFTHLHSLPLEFHTNRKTGEILRIQDRGVSSIESLLSSILFKILPTVADITIACFYFSFHFDLYFGGIVILTMTAYIASTIILTEWHKQHRRRSNNYDNEMEAKAVDSLLNHETVKHNNAEVFEVRVYAEAMQKYQSAEWMNVVSLNVLRSVQNCSMQIGMLIGCLLCTRRIMSGDMTVGDFVLYLAYLNQMYAPLNWFGNSYRLIQKNFVDMERMLEVLAEAPECTDARGDDPSEREGSAEGENTATACLIDLDDSHAQLGPVGCFPPTQAYPNLPITTFNHLTTHSTLTPGGLSDQVQGDIEFRHVTFYYNDHVPILKDVSFKVPAGSTVALVGPSGSGKSTILKLLYRFYEPTAGEITLDGRNIRDLSPRRLRSHLGMVPQDTTLFNDTIRFNIQYGQAGAGFDAVSLSEIEESARSAQIHHKIISLPEGYETRVGERGARLSGGERQRIAIARTILKNPRVVLLDEATSALDTYTELKIQSALQTMTQNRTTLIVAHRLSTVIHADLILVIKDGHIVERGSHAELLTDSEGVYFQLWMTQLREDQELTTHYYNAAAAAAREAATALQTGLDSGVDEVSSTSVSTDSESYE